MDALARATLRACEHCRRIGYVIRHGRLVGYAERTSERAVRGHRLFCSNRHRRAGCGRTFSVVLASVVPRMSVRAATISAFLVALAESAPIASAWRAVSPASARTGYRIATALATEPAIRTVLVARAPPPPVASTSPHAQLLAHVRVVLGEVASLAEYQVAFQRGLFE